MSKKLLLATSLVAILSSSPVLAASDIETLRAEIQAMRQAYEGKIDQLEQKVESLENHQETSKAIAQIEPSAGQLSNQLPPPPATARRQINDNSFNPEIGLILQGNFKSFSEDSGEIAGFAIGEEGERGDDGFGIDETELNISANVDDLFRGSATLAVVEEGGATEVEIEEVYVQTTSLPGGLSLKAGRFFQELGYLNSHHSHSDDFADRPLTNRVFLNSNLNDDGVEASWILPTDTYTEIGGSALKGEDFPAGGAQGSDIGAWTAYGRVGGDIGDDTSWRLGLSTLQVNGGQRSANEDMVTFDGDSGLYIADARLTYAPTGNAKDQELIFQGEYFYRDEDGSYDDQDAGTGPIAYDGSQSGWYAQGVYKFHPQWRVGLRGSQLYSDDAPAGLTGSALDDGDHNPWAAAVMADWTHSEFSRVRAQYNYEGVADGQEDSQFLVQYVMSLGAHGAHPF